MAYTTDELAQSTITIEIKDGAVMDVHGLPDGYQYVVLDHDLGIEPDPEFEFLYHGYCEHPGESQESRPCCWGHYTYHE